jgi:hypothetical protein
MNQKVDYIQLKLSVKKPFTRNSYERALRQVLQLHPHITYYLNQYITSTIQDKEINTQIIRLNAKTKYTLQLFSQVCHYFSCNGIYQYDGIEGEFIITGYEDDPWLCMKYFRYLYLNLQGSLKVLRKAHVKKTQKERYKKRMGKKYNKIIHGTTYASNLEIKFLESYHTLWTKLLHERRTMHKELYKYNQAKIRVIKAHEPNPIRK